MHRLVDRPSPPAGGDRDDEHAVGHRVGQHQGGQPEPEDGELPCEVPGRAAE